MEKPRILFVEDLDKQRHISRMFDDNKKCLPFIVNDFQASPRYTERAEYGERLAKILSTKEANYDLVVVDPNLLVGYNGAIAKQYQGPTSVIHWQDVPEAERLLPNYAGLAKVNIMEIGKRDSIVKALEDILNK